jgi:hypothetical protein
VSVRLVYRMLVLCVSLFECGGAAGDGDEDHSR